jgi:predicted transcriptional regulator
MGGHREGMSVSMTLSLWSGAGASAAPLEQPTVDYLVDPRGAITELGVVCLECGQLFRHLTNTHLQKHGLTSEGYKQRFGYNARRALMIPLLKKQHSENASRNGLARRIRRRPIVDNIELRRIGGRHPHALEELLTRRDRGLGRRYRPLPRDERGRFASAAPGGGIALS